MVQVPLAQNINSSAGSVNDGTYIGFMILTFIGALLAWCLLDARYIQRADGSHVILMKHPVQLSIVNLSIIISNGVLYRPGNPKSSVCGKFSSRTAT